MGGGTVIGGSVCCERTQKSGNNKKVQKGTAQHRAGQDSTAQHSPAKHQPTDSFMRRGDMKAKSDFQLASEKD